MSGYSPYGQTMMRTGSGDITSIHSKEQWVDPDDNIYDTFVPDKNLLRLSIAREHDNMLSSPDVYPDTASEAASEVQSLSPARTNDVSSESDNSEYAFSIREPAVIDLRTGLVNSNVSRNPSTMSKYTLVFDKNAQTAEVDRAYPDTVPEDAELSGYRVRGLIIPAYAEDLMPRSEFIPACVSFAIRG